MAKNISDPYPQFGVFDILVDPNIARLMTNQIVTKIVGPSLDTVSLPERPDRFELLGPARPNMTRTAPVTQALNLVIVPNEKAMAQRGADEIQAVLRREDNPVLGLATGGTMEHLYPEVVRRFHAAKASFRDATTFNLDEYFPPPSSAQSYRHFMNEKLFFHVDLTLTPIEGGRWGQTHIPDPSTSSNSIGESCLAYEQAIVRAGGIDLQILGIGTNGHIGFNEPGTTPWSRTRVVKLSEETRAANARHFGSINDVPQFAITMGISTILEADAIVLLASGASKAAAVRRALTGPIAADCPASWLRLHPRVTFIVDSAAAQQLPPELTTSPA